MNMYCGKCGEYFCVCNDIINAAIVERLKKRIEELKKYTTVVDDMEMKLQTELQKILDDKK